MKSVACFGEILWDVLPEQNFLGGAPYNVAYHLAHLGCAPQLISAVGPDLLGAAALAAAESAGLGTEHVARHPHLPTGIVSVVLDREGQPSYCIADRSAWDEIVATPARGAAVPDAIVYGSLALRSATNRASLRAWLDREPALRVFDVNLRAPHDRLETFQEFIPRATVLKLNQAEAVQLAGPGLASAAPAEQAEFIAARHGCAVVVVTLGEHGAVLWTGGSVYVAKAPPVRVRDTVGAGDAFTAALLAGILNGPAEPDWRNLLTRACALGAFVASRDGAQPAYTLAEVPGFSATEMAES